MRRKGYGKEGSGVNLFTHFNGKGEAFKLPGIKRTASREKGILEVCLSARRRGSAKT